MTKTEIITRQEEIKNRMREIIEAQERIESDIESVLWGLDSYDVASLLNEYWDNTNGYNHIYSIEEDFDDEFHNYSPSEILSMAYHGDYSSFSEWFTLDDGQGEKFYESLDVEDFETYEQVRSYIIDSRDGLGNDEIGDLLEEYLGLEDEYIDLEGEYVDLDEELETTEED